MTADQGGPLDAAGQHEEMVEVHIEWSRGQREVETARPVCRSCWHEGPDGQLRRADWPCHVVQAKADLAAAREALAASEAREAAWRDYADRASDLLVTLTPTVGHIVTTDLLRQFDELLAATGPAAAPEEGQS